MKLPAIQWYPNDWQNDIGVQSLGFEERGIWWEILQRMHQTEERGKMVINGRAMTHEEIAKVIHCDVAKFKQTLQQILSKGVANIDYSGKLINRRMVNDEKFRKMRVDSGSLGGHKTASKRLAKPVAKSTPSSSSSVSSTTKTDMCASGAPLPSFSKAEAERNFETIWKLYPDRTGRKSALRHFLATVKTAADLAAIGRALEKYKASERVRKGFIQNGSTWFNNWQDWTTHQEPREAVQKAVQARTEAARATADAQEREKAQEKQKVETVYQADLTALHALPAPEQSRIRAQAETRFAGNRYLKKYALTLELEMVEIFRS